jgi:hypothetical protein
MSTAWAVAPADRLPDPRPEPCLDVVGDPDEGEVIGSVGLSYEQVTGALNAVIQTALHCPQPDGHAALNLTFQLNVGCDGTVSAIETVDDDGAPEPYLDCVSAVIQKADFDAHDMPDGMTVTYPVNVAW